METNLDLLFTDNSLLFQWFGTWGTGGLSYEHFTRLDIHPTENGQVLSNFL